MSVKKSNVLLMGFYLTLLSCFITYLVLANSYIIENYSNEGNQKEEDLYQTRILDRPIHHLIVRCDLNPENISISSTSRITSFFYGDTPGESGMLITGDTLILMKNMVLFELLLEHKLKSIQFENCEAEIYSSWLQPDASIALVGSYEESNMFFGEGEDLRSVHFDLVGSRLSINQNSNDLMSIDTVRADLYNSEVDFMTSADFIKGLMEVNSHNRYDRISASSELLSKMKLVSTYTDTPINQK